MTPIAERLAGCSTQSLDGYLRGIGFFLLVGDADSSVRAWWDDDGVLWLSSRSSLYELASQAVDQIKRDPPLLRMPWRGKDGRGRDFIDVRNEALDVELDWFDACALARPAAAPSRRSFAQEQSDHENNPLLGQGGSFGRSDPAAAYTQTLAKIRKTTTDVGGLIDLLVAALCNEPPDALVAGQLSTTKAVLGAYQSGRATGAGSSARDVKPTRQPTKSNVWDIVFVLTGLRLFRGSMTCHPDGRASVQASFPFLVRSRPIGTGPHGVHELRADSAGTFELLAPVWSIPCTSRTLRHLVASARLRLRYGAAQDTLDAVLVHASHTAHGLGFDRLVRFALVAGSDPRYRFAVRRGDVHALGLRGARLAVDEILPFLLKLERTVREEPQSLSFAKRRLDDALLEFGRQRRSELPAIEAKRIQEALIALMLLQIPAARTAPGLAVARLSSEWFRLADDMSAEFRLARSLVAGLSDAKASLVRETLLPHCRTDLDTFVLDPTRSPPNLEHVADPLAVLVGLVLTALRRARDESLPPRSGSTSLSDIATLLSGALGRDGERRIVLLCAALAGIRPTTPPSALEHDPAALGIGTDVARLLLAAELAGSTESTAGHEQESTARALTRTENLASLLLAGRTDMARVGADRELRRRGLELLPCPPQGSHASRSALLAFSVLLPLDERTRKALERLVTITPVVSQEGGSA